MIFPGNLGITGDVSQKIAFFINNSFGKLEKQVSEKELELLEFFGGENSPQNNKYKNQTNALKQLAKLNNPRNNQMNTKLESIIENPQEMETGMSPRPKSRDANVGSYGSQEMRRNTALPTSTPTIEDIKPDLALQSYHTDQ